MYIRRLSALLGTTNHTQDFPAAKRFLTKTQRDSTNQKSSGMSGRRSPNFTGIQSCFISSQKALRDSLKCPNGWNETACGGLTNVRLLALNSYEAIWFPSPVCWELELLATGGGQGAVLITGPLSTHRIEAAYEQRRGRSRGKVWGNECATVWCGCPKCVTALNATYD